MVVVVVAAVMLCSGRDKQSVWEVVKRSEMKIMRRFDDEVVGVLVCFAVDWERRRRRKKKR
jgi:hypothetical protein